MRIGFFVWEYPPQLVGGLGTYAEYMSREFIACAELLQRGGTIPSGELADPKLDLLGLV